MTKFQFSRILATTALCLAAVGLLAGSVTACVHPGNDVRESFIMIFFITIFGLLGAFIALNNWYTHNTPKYHLWC